MSRNLVCRVEEQQSLGAHQHMIRLHAPEIARSVRAGEFVMMGLPDLDAMLIRRPFSVARVWPEPGSEEPPRSIDVLYKVFGSRTRAFSGLAPGMELSVLGPLGRGFRIPEEPAAEVELVMVAGGIGNAIFPLLVQQQPELGRGAHFVFGARTAEDLSLLDWFAERVEAVLPVTEDGSAGERGLVTTPLARLLDAPSRRRRVVMACGPTPMLRAVSELCLARDVECQLALEETMACGFGVCLGCVVPKRHPQGEFDRFVRVCKEGPVFDAREVEP